MRYITEMDLRDLYHEEPFTTYYLAADNRLTPGARQFLTDRRIPCEIAREDEQGKKMIRYRLMKKRNLYHRGSC